MPYISRDLRQKYECYELMPPDSGGELNYVISRLIARYTEYHNLSYDTITQVRGALSGSLGEYNRLVAYPYEDSKRIENGCVWGPLIKEET